jgi:hypothetical protein
MAFGIMGPSGPQAGPGPNDAALQKQDAMRAQLGAMQAQKAQAMRDPNAPKGPPPRMGGPGDPGLAQRMQAQPRGIAPGAPRTIGQPPQYGSKPPAPRQLTPPSPGMAGGAFGMKPAAPRRGAFGVPSKAPMSTGQASPFAGGDSFGGSRGNR